MSKKIKSADKVDLNIPENFSDLDRDTQVKTLVEQILEKKDINNDKNALSGKVLFDIIENSYSDHKIPLNTFIVSLSKLVKSKDSKVNCLGKKQGYYLVDKVEEATGSIDSNEESNQTTVESEDKKRNEKEKFLYPVFTNWLFTQGFGQVKDTSSTKNRDLGTWGNPDVTGLNIHEMLGKTTDIEVATIEIKTTLKDWKTWIFESVAHKRFSNRTYFAFAHSEEFLNKIDPDLKHYAELYGVGILILPVSKDLIEKLNSDKKFSTKIEEEYTSTDIIEYASAHYQRTNYHFRGRFLTALGITSEKELHNWGQRIE
ncbi:hypothetical protein [Flectobacillus rivi]|uniref:HTH HARE-type domain-containing protein n=1 Tax=Flectobacillus rivi TaxID=2984209 RepID=A0ABT6Z512_9BACT|nr:hypothetical protein [Flectobacillus rivi]MDI9876210.1 hypothetical protein [Flectobacillus rivi]